VTRSAAFFASLLVSLGRPTWWLLALAGFLARGGILLAILPVVSLPSPLVISNMVSPLVVPLVLGRADAAVVVAIGVLVGAVVAWVVVGGLVGAATDLALIRDGVAAAVDEGVIGQPAGDAAPARPAPSGERRIVAKILTVRLLAHLPFAVALAIGSIGIANVTYAELTNPADVATPLVVRVMAAAARQIIAIVLAWFLGEVAGGVAARRIAIEGVGVRAALGGAIAAMVQRPRSTILPGLVTTIPLAVAIAGTLGGARIAWLRTDAALSDASIDGTTVVAALMTFVAVWIAALTLIALLTAARSAAFTFEAVRSSPRRLRSAASSNDPERPDGGTFGASTHHRPGDWPVGDDGGSL
jgi:hypothetical protein